MMKNFSVKNPILLNKEAISSMKKIEENLVNLIAVDLPYGTTQNKWDEIIPFEDMWNSFNRILSPGGIIVLTASQPFSSKLIMSNLNNFKYEIIWEKTVGSGQLNIKRQPLKVHESILVFYKEFKTYNEQKTKGEPYSIKRKVKSTGENYGKQVDSEKINEGFRHAKSVIKIANPRVKGGHPTQKPVALMEFIINTFSNVDDVVLDCCMGSGTTGVAARILNRKFIGIEKDEAYFKVAKQRIKSL